MSSRSCVEPQGSGRVAIIRMSKSFLQRNESYIVVFLGNLFSTIGDVATVMLRIHLVFEYLYLCVVLCFLYVLYVCCVLRVLTNIFSVALRGVATTPGLGGA